MKKRIFLSVIFLSVSSFAKVPDSPLYKYQHWIKNKGDVIESILNTAKLRKKTYKICEGIDLNLEKAWDLTTGDKKVIVAVIDHGFHHNSKNIIDNIWLNQGEMGLDKNEALKQSNGIDDDNNGFIDDLNGFNFADKNSDVGPCIWDVNRSKQRTLNCNTFHGTMALGIIGAKPNKDFGVTGINCNISMMLLKTSNQNGVGSDHNVHNNSVAASIKYAVDNGAKIINWSGFLEDSTANQENEISSAFSYAKDNCVLSVVASGNSLLNLDDKKNLKKLPFPVTKDFDNVIYIANIDTCGFLKDESKNSDLSESNVKFIGGSNYGLRTFIAAPAENSMTIQTQINGIDIWGLSDGTSAATPMVSGVAALILAVDPSLSYIEIKDILCSTAKKISPLEGKVKCGGLVDGYAAVKLAKSRSQKNKN